MIAIWDEAKSNNRGEILNKNFYRTYNNKDAKLKFEELAFGKDTANYAKDAMDLSTEDLNAIFAKAKELAKESRNSGSRSSRRAETTAADEARPLKCCRLGNVNQESSCELPLFCICMITSLILHVSGSCSCCHALVMSPSYFTNVVVIYLILPPFISS